jgi:hypothetical protein
MEHMNSEKSLTKFRSISADPGQRGSAIVIAMFILALISVFVAYALSRTSAEASAVGNETAEARTMYAAQGSLEKMTRDFNKVFERKLNPTTADLNTVRDGTRVPRLSRELGGDFTFLNEVDDDPTLRRVTTVLSGGPYAGGYLGFRNADTTIEKHSEQPYPDLSVRHLLRRRPRAF